MATPQAELAFNPLLSRTTVLLVCRRAVTKKIRVDVGGYIHTYLFTMGRRCDTPAYPPGTRASMPHPFLLIILWDSLATTWMDGHKPLSARLLTEEYRLHDYILQVQQSSGQTNGVAALPLPFVRFKFALPGYVTVQYRVRATVRLYQMTPFARPRRLV